MEKVVDLRLLVAGDDLLVAGDDGRDMLHIEFKSVSKSADIESGDVVVDDDAKKAIVCC